MEIDIHIHSLYSPDSRSRPEAIVARAISTGLRAIAVTDHMSWEGARATSKIAPRTLLVIPGAELKTDKGDLLALFIDEGVKTNVFAEAVERINALGGVSIVPHPSESPGITRSELSLADGYEAFNATCGPRSNRRSADLASGLGKPAFAASDAHMIMEIGNGRTSVQDCETLAELREVILRNPVISRTVRSNPLVHRANSALMFGLKGIWQR